MTEATTETARSAPEVALPDRDEMKTSERTKVSTLKEMDEMGETDATGAYYCPDCETISFESGGPLYECSECGTCFTRDLSADGCSHRCPDCNRFSGRIADNGCAECGAGETERISVYECPVCDEPVPVEDWDFHKVDHGPAEAPP